MVELTVRQLCFAYRAQSVFHGIDLSVRGGQLLSLVGPNGAGKTTLLKCIDRLLTPTGGSVCIDGRSVAAFSRTELARRVAYVPQAQPQRFPISVFDAVLLGRRPHIGWRASQKDLDVVFRILCEMQIDSLAHRDLGQLSGGEVQKVMLAKALAQEAEILLLDEPTSFLDLGCQLRLLTLVRELVDKRQLCAVVTTHELNDALRYSDAIAVLKGGSLAAFGPPEIVTPALVREVYGVDVLLRRECGRPFLVPVRACE